MRAAHSESLVRRSRPSLARSSRPTGAIHRKIGRQERIDGVAAFFIGGGGDDAARFVENKIDFFGSGEGFAVDLDTILAEAHGRLRIRDEGTV